MYVEQIDDDNKPEKNVISKIFPRERVAVERKSLHVGVDESNTEDKELPVRTPVKADAGRLARLGVHVHLVGHHERRVEADAELADDVRHRVAAAALHLLHEGLAECPNKNERDRTRLWYEFIWTHTYPVELGLTTCRIQEPDLGARSSDSSQVVDGLLSIHSDARVLCNKIIRPRVLKVHLIQTDQLV